MSSRITLVFSGAFALGLTLGACGPTHAPCDYVVCSTGYTCEASNGLCVKSAGVDGGVDGGTDAGAGPVDAGACPSGCPAPSVCDPTTGTCVECLVDSSCTCPTPVCSSAHVCTPFAADAGFSVPPGGEACGNTPKIHTCGQSVSFSTDLATAVNDIESSCAAPNSGGKDLAWTLVLDATFDVRVTAKPSPGSTAEPIVSLRRSCSGNDLVCADSLSGTSTFLLKSLEKGNYQLILDSYSATASGRVNVTIELLPATNPANETCGTAIDLPTDGGVVVDSASANDDLQVCNNATPNSPEVVYRVDLSTTSDLTVQVTGADAGLVPVIALQSTCGSVNSLACSPTAAQSSATLRARNLAAGRYYVVVENSGPATGLANIVALATSPVAAPPNDTCNAPRAISFATGATTASFTVDTWLANDDTAGTCSATPSPEVVYSLALGAQRTVTVDARRSGSSTTDTALYLRSATCAPLSDDGGVADAGTNEVGCARSTLSRTLDAGTYFLFVEGLNGGGPTDVTVTLSP